MSYLMSSYFLQFSLSSFLIEDMKAIIKRLHLRKTLMHFKFVPKLVAYCQNTLNISEYEAENAI